MPTKPMLARTAFAIFAVIGAGITINILFLQDRSVATSADRARLEKADQRAQAERNRRLALAAAEPPAPAATAALVRPASAGELAPARQGRVQVPPASPAKAAAFTDVEPDRSPDVVRSLYQRLATLGYEPGAASPVPGLVMRAAVMAYEHDHGLPLSGEATEYLLRHIDNAPGAREAAARLPRASRHTQAEQVTRTIQQSLAALGYYQAKIDGRLNEDTARAIREYEMDAGLVPTGRVSGPLVVRLARSASASRQPPVKPPVR